MGLSEPLTVSEVLASTNNYVALGAVDTGTGRSLVYTLKVATNNLLWTVYGANVSDYSDEVVVQAEAQVNAGAVGSYSTTQAVYRYYRAKIKAAVADAQGTATINGLVKG